RSKEMSTVQPQGEDLRNAVRWISESLKEDETASIQKLIQEASFKFNLSPKDEQFLMSFYKKQ
ncbi:MAG: hypothetical protein KJ645_09430, partial [Planctomycetes bacterium]|nr:hypothetical protein [Planctomycetota bacterium]